MLCSFVSASNASIVTEIIAFRPSEWFLVNGSIDVMAGSNHPSCSSHESAAFGSESETRVTLMLANKISATKYFRCVVEMLDESTAEIEVERFAKGSVLFKEVVNSLDIAEPDYFGLQFSRDSEMAWLEHGKGIRKQMKGHSPYKLHFRVRFFPTEPSRIAEDLTRYHMFLNVKQDLIRGRLSCPTETAAELSSLIVQSEAGDYHPTNLPDQYISDYQLIPNQTPEFEERVFHYHKENIGLSPAEAELKFLEIARRLELYGSEVFKAKDSDHHSIDIIVCSEGIKISRDNKRINIFAWSRIEKVLFNRKNFFIQLLPDVDRDPRSQPQVGFSLQNIKNCKILWKTTVAHHTFYRRNSFERLNRHPKLIRFGSTYSYRGKTQCQAVEAARRSYRKERKFKRTGSSRNFGRSSDKGNLSFSSRNHRYPDDVDSRMASSMTTSQGSYEVIESHSAPSLSPARRVHSEMNGILNDEGLLEVRVHPNDNGQFGLNFKGGAEQKLKPIITQIAPGSPASMCDPQLQEGDEIVCINSRPAAKLTHEQICCLIRSIGQSALCNTLVLSIRPFGTIKSHEIDHSAVNRDISSQLPVSMAQIREGLENGDLLEFYVDMPKRKPGLTTEVAHYPENKSKNRYRDILPYDFNRVIIKGDNDYINASHVQMEIDYEGTVNDYVAAQGPLSDTCADFWQMIWDQDTTLIVMLTTTMENGKTKCHRYWPECGEQFEIGNFEVSHVSSRDFSPSYIHRELRLTDIEGEEDRVIQHLQYIAWPDHGVPEDARMFLNFVEEVRQYRTTFTSPVTIHCSAGVGRTGVFIAVETACCLIEAALPVYPGPMLETLRGQRPSLIQTPGQFKFTCEAILELYRDYYIRTQTNR